MLSLPSWAMKTIAGIFLAVGMATATLVYRDHVFNEGYAQATTDAKTRYDSALTLARTTDKLISDQAEAALRATLKDESNAHKARQVALEVALAAARADTVRLSNDLARLYNDAVAGRSPSTAGTTTNAGTQGDPAEAAGGGAVASPGQFSLADLMRNDEENYTICRKNAAQLTAVQDWYNAIRRGDAAGAARAVAEAPGE